MRVRSVRNWVVGLVCAGCAGALAVSPDAADARGKRQGAGHAGGYVIEFRSRPSEYFGHGYVVVGRETRSGRIAATRKAGFMPHPKADDLEAVAGVKGVVGFTAEDRRTASDERYRVRVSRAAHDRVVARIDANKRKPRAFALFDENCNTFAGRMARAGGLKAPDDDLVAPSQYVRNLRELNGRARTADAD